MPQQVSVQQVLQRLPDWGNDFGTFHAYLLQVAGLDKPLEISQKPDRAAPAQGDSFWVETKDHPQNPAWLKGKRVAPPQGSPQTQAPRNGSPSVSHDDPTRRSIEAQTALKAAVEYHARDEKAPIDVVQTAAVFADWLGQRS